MNKKVIFLDIDGVLNSTRTLIADKKIYNFNSCKQTNFTKTGFDPVACHILYNFCIKNNVRIVIISAWRSKMSVEDFNLMFRNAHNWNTHVVIDITPTLGGERETEVLTYLQANPSIDKFAIVDDAHFVDSLIFKDKWVNVDYNEGFIYKNYLTLCEILDVTPERVF